MLVTANLVIMQVILPLVAGLGLFLLPKRFSWLFSAIAIGATTLIALSLLSATFNLEEIYYNLGGWSSKIGIEYKVDKLNSFFMLIISIASLINILAMKSLIGHELDLKKTPLFFGLFLIALTGLLGICISNDIFNIYVLLEVNAIASYALVASAKKKDSTKAAFDYLIFGTIGSTMILFGIGFIYALVGSLNLTIISAAMPALLDNNAAKAGVALILFGVLMKAALFPLSSWLVNIYQGAPSFVGAMLAATSNKVGVYLLLRFFFKVFHLHQYPFDYLNITLLLLAIVAILACAVLALRQTNIKRFLAYSSLSQVGFIIFALALASKLAISGVLVYCFTHALEKTVLFLAAGYFIASASDEEITSFAGLRKSHPWLCLILIINFFSTMGIPMTAGFVGKWLLFKAALDTDIWYIFIMLVATIFTFSYSFKFIELLIFKGVENEKKIHPLRNGKVCLWFLTIATMLNLYIGVYNQGLLYLVKQISQVVLP